MSSEKPATVATPPARPPAVARAYRAWLANKKQELLAPVLGMRELSEMLLQDARDRSHEAFLVDMDKARDSTLMLAALLEEMLDPARGDGQTANINSRARHELRTPLTHILGLCDLWLEDVEDQLLEGLLTDLIKMQQLGKKLLASIDELVAFHDRMGDADIELDQMMAALPPAAQESVAGQTGVLLVVDDNEINRDLLTRRLVRQGHTVVAAADGRQGLALARERAFDLILLDVLMPEMNGFEVLARLKDDEQLRHVPVIMISALDEIESVVRCISLGAEDYLSKPFNPVLLRARIDACLEKKRLRDREVLYLEQIKREQKRADDLLHVILPSDIVRELKENNTVLPRRYDNVAVLFCDVVGFTPYCDSQPPEEAVARLQRLIESWEEIAVNNCVEKIKTIGDAFMAASGLLCKTTDSPVLHCVRCGLEMIATCQELAPGWNLRVGIHSGLVVAGVIGKRQYLFDLWGDTVNTAARMESHGVPGAVVLSSTAWQQIADRCRGQSLGQVPVKGKGSMEMVRFDGMK